MASNLSTASKHHLRQLTDFTLHRRAVNSIAQGYLTNSKRPQSLVMGVYPTHLKRGRGCHVWDHSGKKYIDFITGLGTNLIGYANETVNSVVKSALDDGNLFSLATDHEITAAEKLKELFPFVDLVKFCKTGSDACEAAVRIARAHTKRNLILSDGYHGWADGFVSLSPPAYGVPPSDALQFAKLSEHDITDKVAAVIVEPVITDLSTQRIEYLKALREICTKRGVVLIFDEVITGFRFPKFSVSGYLGIIPDLICLGKAMANGFPISAVCGKRSIMNCEEYFVSSTYAGCVDALVASKKVMELLQKTYKIEDLWSKGTDFINTFNSYWPEGIRIEGYPTRGVFVGDPIVKALLFQEACFAGILLGPSFWFNFPLAAESFGVLQTLKEIVDRIKSGGVKLLGEMPTSPFAQRVREIKG